MGMKTGLSNAAADRKDYSAVATSSSSGGSNNDDIALNTNTTNNSLINDDSTNSNMRLVDNDDEDDDDNHVNNDDDDVEAIGFDHRGTGRSHARKSRNNLRSSSGNGRTTTTAHHQYSTSYCSWGYIRHSYCCQGIAMYLWLFLLTLTILLSMVTKRYHDLTISSSSTNNGIGSSATTSSTASTNNNKYSVTYDPTIATLSWNPLNLQPIQYSTTTTTTSAGVLSPPPYITYTTPSINDTITTSTSTTTARMGYIMQPDIVNNTCVFVSDGNLYYTQLSGLLDDKNSNTINPSISTAMRLTTTLGNVRTPKINPHYPYIIAFTATYHSRRDIYILDLRRYHAGGSNIPVQRLTYVDSPYGVSSIVEWNHDGTKLIYSASSMAIGLGDLRLYEIAIEQQPQSSSSTTSTSSTTILQVLETRSIPLSQATEGTVASDTGNDNVGEECIYFVRYKQGSHTARYVGGTAEQLYAYCDGQETTVALTSMDYNGTSKHPTIYTLNNNQRYLLFLSDRSPMTQPVGPTVFQSGDQKWRATTMNLWATPLPNSKELYSTSSSTTTTLSSYTLQPMVQLTYISCHFNGQALQEYAVDAITGHVVLRIGADLHHLPANIVQAALLSLSSSDTGGTTTTATEWSKFVPLPVPIHVVSDYHEQHERIIKVDMIKHMTKGDVFTTAFDTTSCLLTVRGQVWVVPVLDDTVGATSTVDTMTTAGGYQGSGQNIPHRRYRVIPGAMTGGAIRVLAALHIPLYVPPSDGSDDSRRLSLVLATDPLSPTAEHAFYVVEVHAESLNAFVDLDHVPTPFVGGHVNGGATIDGGLGTVDASSVVVSPCGRRFAWTDTDNRICVMTIPIYTNATTTGTTNSSSYQCLPRTNDLGEPMSGTLSKLSWSPGGRYLGVEHNALNQFSILSIVDCGDPEPTTDHATSVSDIRIGLISQVTPSRFNCYGMYWGISTLDIFLSNLMKSLGLTPDNSATTLYFLSDRDIVSDVTSPWGSRAPMPHFASLQSHVYALPLTAKQMTNGHIEPLTGRFPGGGSLEVFHNDLATYEGALKSAVLSPDEPHRHLKAYILAKLKDNLQGRKLSHHERHAVVRYLQKAASDVPSNATTTPVSPFVKDSDLDLPTRDLSFARRAYRMAQIPIGKYVAIASQAKDDASLVLIDRDDDDVDRAVIVSMGPFPSDVVDISMVPAISNWWLSTNRKHLFFVSSPLGKTIVVSNTASGLAGFARDAQWTQNRADTSNLAVSVWPVLEYRQMYNDAWRLMRDYFYDANMHHVDWKAVYSRYAPLVQRCGKREELDDVLGQMASETSALHSFVYGGEYRSPEQPLWLPASLGASMKRSPEWKGYMITELPERDPDYGLVDGVPIYCPICDQALKPTGQRGLLVGDVIVAVNGESVMMVPDINMLLRGTVGRSVRLEVLRLQSGTSSPIGVTSAIPEPVIVVPISTIDAAALRLNAWEWKTGVLAKELAKNAGFSVGYIHIQAMDRDGEDAFTRGFFPDHDKDGLIIDVRHNSGGNIDSWILTMLQRKAWMYWASRSSDKRYGELDWNEQFAFRGKLVVLVDESTSSDGEGFARGVMELGLGRVIGTRTWGGGIWGSSVNRLVDGGIAAAPQWGVFNDKFGWGGGIEATGLTPDIIVDNDPRLAFDGRDVQLERAIAELKAWLKKEPIPAYRTPLGGRPDMSLTQDDCPA